MNAEQHQPTRAILTLADERSARRVADILSEAFDNGETAVAAFENAERRLGHHHAFRRAAG